MRRDTLRFLLFFLLGSSVGLTSYVFAFERGYKQAQHDVALHWYRECVTDPREKGLNPMLYCGVQGAEMRYALGFDDRWLDEMP